MSSKTRTSSNGKPPTKGNKPTLSILKTSFGVALIAILVFFTWNVNHAIFKQENAAVKQDLADVADYLRDNTTSRLDLYGGNQPGQAAIHPRADARSYDSYVASGKQFVRLVESPPQCVAQSLWTTYPQLTDLGWVRSTASRDVKRLGQGVVNMFDALQISTDVNDNRYVMWHHIDNSQPQEPGNIIYKATGGIYESYYNSKLIIADNSFGPVTTGEQEDPPVTGSAVVPLRQWSDVTYLEWSHMYTDKRELKGILRSQIANSDTMRVIAHVLKQNNEQLKWWTTTRPYGPTFFDKDSEEFAALLATPNGNGVAWLLLQHKYAMEYYEFLGVSIFYSDTGTFFIPSSGLAPEGSSKYNMLFHVQAGPNPPSWGLS